MTCVCEITAEELNKAATAKGLAVIVMQNVKTKLKWYSVGLKLDGVWYQVMGFNSPEGAKEFIESFTSLKK